MQKKQESSTHPVAFMLTHGISVIRKCCVAVVVIIEEKSLFVWYQKAGCIRGYDKSFLDNA